MRGPQDGEAWGFVAAAGFDPDEAVLHDVDAADSVAAGEGVGGKEDFEAARDGARGCYELNGYAFRKDDGKVLG